MTIRIGAIAILFLSVLFMMRGISETWKDRALPEIPIKDKNAPASESIDTEIALNPEPSLTQPDLKQGYLFNDKRTLVEKKDAETEPVEPLLSGNDVGINTDINTTTFSGALIADTFKKAIITYTPAPDPAAKSKSRRASRLSRRSKKSLPARRGKLETTMLMEGDIISGYKVAAIEPDRILFQKEDETVEKFIYDPDKQRAAPVSRAKPASLAPPRPGPGAAGAPTSAPTRPGATNRTTAPQRTTAAAPSTAQRKPAAATRRPSTTRRLVVSRKPPPKPDTSRVSRRRRSTGSPPPSSMGTPFSPPNP